MPERSFPRRLVLLLVLAVMCLSVSSATPRRIAYKYKPVPKGKSPRLETLCTKGNRSPSRPLLCINEDTLKVDPDPAYVFDVEAYKGRPTMNPVIVHWFTQRSADLHIQFAPDNACVEELSCDAGGHCSAKVKALTSFEHKQCHYQIFIGNKKTDPEFIVNPCCW